MASRQDLRQSQAKTQAFKQLGTVANADLGSIVDKINTELNSPLKLAATFPTANAVLNFEQSIINSGDGAKESLSPIKSQIYTIPASTVNFQTQATSGATFIIVWPTNTIGYFRNVGFTLLGNGNIQALFSAEAVTQGALPNPGALFVKSGVALGYVALEATSASAFKTAGSVTDIIENTGIYRFSTGSGGGSGTGDANSFTENLKHRLTSSFYEFVTPNVFESDEDVLIDTATASFDLVDGVYSFDAAENIVSKNMFCEEFLDSDEDTRRVELHAEWFDEASTDSNAIYEASLNVGTTFEAITMTRQGQSFKFTGDKELALPASVSLYAQATETQTTELNATTLRSLAKKVTVTTKSSLASIQVSVVKTGSPSGSYNISLVSDNVNAPTGTILYSKIALNSTLSAGTNVITLSDFRSVVPAGDYWIVVSTDSTYQASFVTSVTSIGLRTTTGTDQVFNGTTWVAGTASLKYQLSGYALDLRVRITSSASSKKLKAYGIFYREEVGSVITGFQALQKFSFSGDANVYQFTVTNFLPNADHLKVYDISTGQVYRYGAFSINGKVVSFTSGTFTVPGATIELMFDQSEGTGYDYSDANNNLLASNHLGSVTPTLDKSLSGRGILIRNSAGELKEIWLDAANNLNITDPL
jgi:hypothetical protein